MCATCGCETHHQDEHWRDGHGHAHAHDPPHEHDAHDHHHEAERRTLRLERDVLAKNDAYARQNRAWLAARGVAALNLVSSPGAGKTTLLEATIRALQGRLAISVLEGDQETERDAERIRATGARAIQLNTGKGCHLEAHTVGHALERLSPPPRSLVMIENVGNLVCPALFDLGEHAKVVVLSVTEGDDKPLKYPHMFRASRVMVLNKQDLLPHVRFDVDACLDRARRVSPELQVFVLSATTGEGIAPWCDWLLRLAPGAPAAS